MSDLIAQNSSIKQEIDYTKFLKIVFSRWYWILFTLIISLTTCYIYLWYTQSVYSAKTFLKFESQESSLEQLLTIKPGAKDNTTISSESWIIKSDTLASNALSNLDWEVSYFIKGKIRNSEMYPDKPFVVNILSKDSVYFSDAPISFNVNANNKIRLEYTINGVLKELYTVYSKPIKLPGITFKIVQNNILTENKEFFFVFNSVPSYIQRIKENLKVEPVEKSSNIAIITKTDTNPTFAKDVLDALSQEYLKYNIAKKRQSAKQVIEFVDDQLSYLATKVANSGNKLKTFKQENNFVQLNDATKITLDKVTGYESQLENLKQADIYLKEILTNLENDNQNLNFNLIGDLDPILLRLTLQWNDLLNTKDQISKTYSENSKQILDINQKILNAKNSAKQNILQNIKLNSINRSNINKDLKQKLANLKNIPTQERQLFDLEREYDINDKIYTLLAEKKLESQITQASVLPDAEIVDSAKADYLPVFPNSSNIWKLGIIFGIASGIGLIFLARILKPYIYDKEMIESLTSIPIIGLVRHYPGKLDEDSSQILSIVRPKSLFAESVRSVRTNLSFITGNDESKVICVTSEISGEGKSFVSLNIAASLGLINKKVVLIAADLRKSKIHKSFNLNNQVGLSNYLISNATLDDIINDSAQENLDVITSGIYPPNPAELMYKDRLHELIIELKKRYDIVIFDTAPVGLVSDALPLIRESDVNLFVIRTGKSKISAATIPDRISAEYQLKNTYIILNDFIQDPLYSHYYSTKYSDGYYGYYYSSGSYDGTGYYDEEGAKRNWFKRKIGSLKKLINSKNNA